MGSGHASAQPFLRRSAAGRELIPAGPLPRPRTRGVPVPAELRARMEQSFGSDFSTVRLHSEPALRALGARALTRGEDIYFAGATLDFSSSSAQALLGEELAHAVQQRQGRVPALDGLPTINVSPTLERDAVQAGARAARGEPALLASTMGMSLGARADVIQGSWLTSFLQRIRRRGGGGGGGGVAPAVVPAPAAAAPPAVAPPAIVRTPNMGLSEQRPGSRQKLEELMRSRWEQTIEGRVGDVDASYSDEQIASDLSRVAEIVLDQRRFEALLVPLDERMEELQAGAGGHLKLGTAIAEFERRHGFGVKQQIPLGVLPGPVFLDLMGSGMVPKDIGAGLPHGEMSHRIQWVAIMQDFEDNPDEWAMTPLELLALTNLGPVGWFQGVVLDQAEYSPEEGYSHPDNMLRFMRHDDQTRTTLPTLSAAIEARWDKRVNAAVAAVNAGRDINLDPALSAAYRAKKEAAGWTVREGTGADGKSWAVLVAPGPDDAPLAERIAEQRKARKRRKRERERNRLARNRELATAT